MPCVVAVRCVLYRRWESHRKEQAARARDRNSGLLAKLTRSVSTLNCLVPTLGPAALSFDHPYLQYLRVTHAMERFTRFRSLARCSERRHPARLAADLVVLHH
jgi:hypothetical protein